SQITFQKASINLQQRSTLKDTYGSEKNSKVVKFADDFENIYAFKLTERHRTERFKDFVIKTTLKLKTLLYGPF
ncbi:hypothetical protein, partial [Bartonella sp. MM97QHHN]|uniref:hypothetical protein n=1 Tax=Bartonella sp. MM97QHHN TaxID=3243553 RepID=UPI0035D104EA